MRRDRLDTRIEPVAMCGRPNGPSVARRRVLPRIVGALALALAWSSGCGGQKTQSQSGTDIAAPPPPSGSVTGSAAPGSASGSASGSAAGGSPAASGATPPASPAGDEARLPPPPPPPDQAPPSGAVMTTEGWSTPAPERQLSGYRLQIFATSDRQRAEETAVGARKSFSEPVYVEFEAPLYKVRIGDCATRHEAEMLRDKASTLGYDGSWIAETMVTGR
jgi:SPOR domain